MSLIATRKAFVDWVKSVTTYDANHVIWDEQNMPKPSKPYITLKLTAFVQPNHSFVTPPNSSGVSKVLSDKEFTLSINCLADIATDPVTVLIDLHESLSLLLKRIILTATGIAFVTNLLGPTDTTQLKDSMYEKRATNDLLMRIPWSVTDSDIGYINTVAIETVAIRADGITIDVNTQTINP